MMIHPNDAKARGLKTGDVARVYNDRGEILAGVLVSEYIKEGAVRISEGAWLDLRGKTCVHGSANVLITDEPTSQLAQGNQANSLVEVAKFEGELPKIECFNEPKIIKI